MRLMAVLFVAAWFIAAVSVCSSGVLEPVPSPVLLIGGFVIPIAAYTAAYSLSIRFRAFVLSRSLRFLTLAESSRICGFVFLIAYKLGILPGRYALPTGISDMAIGATAVVAGFVLIAEGNTPKRGLLLWHCLGVLGMVISGTLGILTSATPVGVLTAPPTSHAMSSFPWNLVPVFLGPLTLLFHVMAVTIILARKWRSG